MGIYIKGMEMPKQGTIVMILPDGMVQDPFFKTVLGKAVPDMTLETIRFIDEQPTIEPERKKGKWIFVDGKYYCSECDEEQDCETRYCSGCGAEMEGGQDEHTD